MTHADSLPDPFNTDDRVVRAERYAKTAAERAAAAADHALAAHQEIGRAVGHCSQVYLGRNVFECGPRAPINASSLGSLKSESNLYTSPGAPCVIAGGPNIAVVDSANDYYAQAQFCDGPPTHLRKFP